MANKQTRYEEALKRLKFLKDNGMKYSPAVDFFKKGDVGIFECQNNLMKSVFYGLYLNQGQEEYDKLIEIKEHFENKHNITIYLILVNYTRYGKMYSMFYVSNNEEEYECEWDNLKDKYSTVYAFLNYDYTMYDIGDIKFEYDPLCGGIYRVG